MLFLSRADVEARLDLDALIAALAPAMVDLSSGAASSPARVVAQVPGADGFLGAMPGFVPSNGVLMAKLVTLFPHNTDLPTHQALIVAFDPETEGTIALELAYSLARARVLMQRSESEGVDASAVHDSVERALQVMEMVRTVKSTLTGATTNIEKARTTIDAMAAQVRGYLEQIDELVRSPGSGEGAEEPAPESQRTLI